jgi:hypothetical protein
MAEPICKAHVPFRRRPRAFIAGEFQR